jgi:hypothetical protein
MTAIVPLINATLGLGTGFTGSNVLIEPSFNSGYTRQSGVTFSTFTGGTGSNDAQISFGIPALAWGTLTSWALFDGNGNQVFYGSLLNPINGTQGQDIMVPIGYCTLTFAAVG